MTTVYRTPGSSVVATTSQPVQYERPLALDHYWTQPESGRFIDNSNSQDASKSYIARSSGGDDNLERLIRDVSTRNNDSRQRSTSRKNSKSDDSSSDDEPSDNYHTETENQNLPVTIIITTGHYRLNGELDTNTAINFVSTAYSGNPNAIINLEKKKVLSYGKKSWQGCIFKNGTYIIDSRSGSEKFTNCDFKEYFSISLKRGNAIFKDCNIFIENINKQFLKQIQQSSFSFLSCNFDINGQGDKKANCLIKLLGCDENSNIIENCIINISAKSRAQSCSRPFSIFQLGSTQELIFTKNQVKINPTNNRIFVFGNWERLNGARLNATYNTYENLNSKELFVSLLGGVWSAPVSTTGAIGGSIFITHSTLRDIRLLSFNSGICNHNELCASETNCSHCGGDFSSWDQSIVVTYTNIFLSGPSTDQRSAIITLDGPNGSIWKINLTNSILSVNNGNIPIALSNVESAVINLSGTSLVNNNSGGTVPNSPYLIVNNLPGGVTLLTNGSTTVSGLQNPIVTGQGSINTVSAMTITM